MKTWIAGLLVGMVLGEAALAGVADVSIGDATVVEGDSGTSTLQFPVTRSGDTTSNLAIEFTAADDTATGGVDFTVPPAGSLLHIPAGQTSGTLSIPVIGDTDFEPDETLLAQLAKIAAFNPDPDFDSQRNDYVTGSGPHTVAVGDLDGDGKADLAVTNRHVNTVSVLRNTSTLGSFDSTSFAPAVNFSVGSNPHTVAIADLDGDGRLDLAVANRNSNSISLLRNTSGPGVIDTNSFAAALTIYAGSSCPVDLAVGELDGAGRPDIVVADRCSSLVFVLRNTSTSGNLSFASPFAYSANNSCSQAVAIGDLDGDGKNDLAVANRCNNNVSVLRNNATAGVIDANSFQSTVLFSVGSNPHGITIDDVDADGKPELAVAHTNNNAVGLLHNTATAGTLDGNSFAPVVTFNVGSSPHFVSIGDLDGDSKPDLAIANRNDSSVSILRNTTSPGVLDIGSFATAVAFFSGGSCPISLATSDLDGDAVSDIVAANDCNDFVSVFRNGSVPGAFSFDLVAPLPQNANPYFVATGDLDSDGKLDLVAANRGRDSLSVLRNVSNTSVQYAAPLEFGAGNNPEAAAIGDADGDAKPDLAVANTASNTIWVLRNTSTGGTHSFESGVEFEVGSAPSALAFGDVDGDGRQDIAVSNQNSNTVSILRNTSTSVGVISYTPTVNVTVGSRPMSVRLADIDLDGKIDLMTANADSDTVSVRRNTSVAVGSVSFASAVSFAVGDLPWSLAVGDIDGDGRSEILVANEGSNTISVLRNVSTAGTINNTSLASAVTFAVESCPYSVAVGDVTGDGKLDVVAANLCSNSLSVLRNTATSGVIDSNSFAAGVAFGVGRNPISVAIGDADGDAKPELISADSSSNTISLLRNSLGYTGSFLDNEGIGTIQNDDVADTTPDTFGFTNVTGVNPSTVQTSNTINITGINTAAQISVVGGSYSVGCTGTFTSATTTIGKNQSVCVQQTASANYDTPTTVTLTIGGVDGFFEVRTRVGNTTPVQFMFVPNSVSGLDPNAVTTSNPITVSGIEAPAPITLNNGQFCINSNPCVNMVGATVNNGDTVAVRLTASSSFNTAVSGTLNIGGVTATYSATTVAEDTTPDPFAFAPVANAAVSSVQTSNTITVAGINSTAPATVTGGTLSINGGAFVAAGNVTNGNQVVVRQTASASPGTTTTATLTIGGVSAGFAVTTQSTVPDTTPDSFAFQDQAAVPLSSTRTSNTVTVAGISQPATVSVTGGEYGIGCANFTSSTSTVAAGQTVCVRHVSSAAHATAVDTVLTIGGVSDTFTTTTQALDGTPNPFSFADRASAPVSSTITSNTVAVTGFNVAVQISVVGGEYSTGCTASFTSASSTINAGQAVCVRHLSASANGVRTDTTLTVGGVSDTFSSVTGSQTTSGSGFGSGFGEGGGGGAVDPLILGALAALVGWRRWRRGSWPVRWR